jgi:YidC/Oxa1 family membrane protein insertase
MPIGFLWQTLLETPLINSLVFLTAITFGSYGFAILIFTVITRLVTFPLTMRTLRTSRRMQEIAPLQQEIQKKYSDPKRRSEETMKLYREAGVNPLGCLGPQLIQMPIFIALYQVIRITISNTPEGVLYLQGRLYDIDIVQNAVPLSTNFLVIDMAATGNANLPLVAIVFASMWLQQRISSSRSTAGASQQTQQMNQMMQWFMPVMFSWFVLFVPAGLGLYWASTTIIGIVLHWVFLGPGDFTWGSLIPQRVRAMIMPATAGASVPIPQPTTAPEARATEARTDDGQSGGDQRNRRRRGNRTRTRETRSQTRSGRRRRRSGR